MPAELTSTSIRPNARTHAAASRSVSATRATSAAQKRTRGRTSEGSVRSAASPRAASLPAISTQSPAAAKRCAAASPMPDVPPVMSTALLSCCPSKVFSLPAARGLPPRAASQPVSLQRKKASLLFARPPSDEAYKSSGTPLLPCTHSVPTVQQLMRSRHPSASCQP